MKKGMDRRKFVAGTAAAGAFAVIGCNNSPASLSMQDETVGTEAVPDLAVAKGGDIEKLIRASVDAMGGMGAFVEAGQSVGILINILGAIPAAHTKPETVRTVAAMCREAGASKVTMMDWREMSRWEQNRMIEVANDPEIVFDHVDLEKPELWRAVDVPRGKVLKQTRIFNALWEHDVFIMLPIFKHHSGAAFTGALKLYMGTTHRHDNRGKFHASRELQQCIADLNTVVRPPDLIIMDAFEVLVGSGPVGPGPTSSPGFVVAGRDRVAMDTYCAPVQNINPAESIQIKGAYEHGVGEMDLAKLKIKEFDVA